MKHTKEEIEIFYYKWCKTFGNDKHDADINLIGKNLIIIFGAELLQHFQSEEQPKQSVVSDEEIMKESKKVIDKTKQHIFRIVAKCMRNKLNKSK